MGDTAGENGRNGSSPVTDGSRGTRDDLSLPEVQRRILAKAAGLCRPNGGALVYATCSLLREENECVRAWFDTRFGDDFVPVPFEAHWPLAPDDVTGDVDEGDVARDDVDEDGNAMDDGAVAVARFRAATRPSRLRRFLRRSVGSKARARVGARVRASG